MQIPFPERAPERMILLYFDNIPPSYNKVPYNFTSDDPNEWYDNGLVTALAIDNVVRKNSFPKDQFSRSCCMKQEEHTLSNLCADIIK